MDDSVKQASPSIRHRLDSGSAARTEGAGRPMAGHDGPRADSIRALEERERSRDRERPIDNFGFDVALQYLHEGKRVARAGWNGKGQFIALAFGSRFSGPGINHGDGRACIVIQPVSGPLVPWIASQTDLLAFDWCFVREVSMLQYGNEGYAVPSGENRLGGPGATSAG